VYKAIIKEQPLGNGPPRPAYLAAVKTLKEGSTRQDKQELMEEAAINALLQHDNLVALIGVCTKGSPVMLVLEYVPHVPCF